MIPFRAADKAYGYGTVERALATVMDIDLKKDGRRFKAQLRHLKNIGVPKIPKPGRGQKVEYSYWHALEMAFALYLQKVGVAPQRAAAIAAKAAADVKRSRNQGQRMYMIVPPSDPPITLDLDEVEK